MNMLSISHAATGAFIAAKISNPYLAIPLIIATHYLQDAVPHWDVGTGLSKGTKTRTQAFIHEIPDLALALVIVYLMYPAIFNIQYSQIISNRSFIIFNSSTCAPKLPANT